MSAEELTVLATIRDEMSAGLVKIGAEVDALTAKIDKQATVLGRHSKTMAGHSKTLDSSARTFKNLGSLGDGRLAGRLTQTGGALQKLSQTKAVGVLSALGAAGDQLGTKLDLHSKLSTLSSDLEGVTTEAAKMTAGFALAGVGLAAFGVKAVAGFQQSLLGLQTLTGSTATGTSLFNSLKGMTGIFSTQTLATNAVSMLNQGTSASVIPQRMKALANIAAVQVDPAASMSSLVSGVNSIQHTGRITTEGLDSLASAGIPGYDILSQQLGVTKIQVAQLVSENKISAQSFLNMIDTLSGPGLAKFRNGMKQDTQTIGGMFDTLKNRITLDLANASGPLATSLGHALPQISNLVNTLINTVAPFGVKILGSLIGPLTKDLPLAFAKLQPVLPAIESSFSKFAAALVKALPSLVELIADLLPILPAMVNLAADVLPVLTVFAKLISSSSLLRNLFAGVFVALLAFNKLNGVISTVRAFASAVSVLAGKLSALSGAEEEEAATRAAETAVDDSAGAAGGAGGLGAGLGGAGGLLGEAGAAGVGTTGALVAGGVGVAALLGWGAYTGLHPSSLNKYAARDESLTPSLNKKSLANIATAAAASRSLLLQESPAKSIKKPSPAKHPAGTDGTSGAGAGGNITQHITINGTKLSQRELTASVAEAARVAYQRGSTATTANGTVYGLSKTGS
jgi:hypothetical protein